MAVVIVHSDRLAVLKNAPVDVPKTSTPESDSNELGKSVKCFAVTEF
jgi:hypothetical protein